MALRELGIYSHEIEKKFSDLQYSKRETRVNQKLAEEIHRELLHTFTPETAYLAYVPFARLMGGMHMEQILNSDIVWRLSSRVSEQSGEQRNTVCAVDLNRETL